MVLCNVLLLLQCGSKEENIHYIVGGFFGGGGGLTLTFGML